MLIKVKGEKTQANKMNLILDQKWKSKLGVFNADMEQQYTLLACARLSEIEIPRGLANIFSATMWKKRYK